MRKKYTRQIVIENWYTDILISVKIAFSDFSLKKKLLAVKGL